MSEAKIKIKNLFKIFGKNPLTALERVKNGVGKDELQAFLFLIPEQKFSQHSLTFSVTHNDVTAYGP